MFGSTVRASTVHNPLSPAQQWCTKKSFTPLKVRVKKVCSLTLSPFLTGWLSGWPSPAHQPLPTICNTDRSSGPLYFFRLQNVAIGKQAHFCFYSLHRSIVIFFLFLHCTVDPVFLGDFLWRFELSFTSPADGSVLLENRQQLQAGRECAASGLRTKSCFILLKVFFFSPMFYPAKTGTCRPTGTHLLGLCNLLFIFMSAEMCNTNVKAAQTFSEQSKNLFSIFYILYMKCRFLLQHEQSAPYWSCALLFGCLSSQLLG